MSAGNFDLSKYADDNGVVYPCKAQPETKQLTIAGITNAQPLGAAATGVPSARLRGSKRQIGVNARSVTIRLTGTLAGYAENATITLPVFTKATWDAYSKTETGTYLSTACVVVGKTPEYIV